MSLSSLGSSLVFFLTFFQQCTCGLRYADLLTFCSPKTASHLKWTGSTTVPWLRTSQMERKSWHEINGCVTRFGIQKLESLWSAFVVSASLQLLSYTSETLSGFMSVYKWGSSLVDYAYRHALKSISIEIKIRGANNGSQVGGNYAAFWEFPYPKANWPLPRRICLWFGASGLLEELLPAIWPNEVDFSQGEVFCNRFYVPKRRSKC